MLEFFIFVVFPNLGVSANLADLQWTDGSPANTHTADMFNCCLTNTDLSSFKMSMFSGLWHIWGYYDDEKYDRDCIEQTFDVDEHGLMSSITSWFTNPDKVYIKENAYYRQLDPSKPAVFKCRSNPSDPSTERDFWILGTDYISWASVYQGRRIVAGECKVDASILIRHNFDQTNHSHSNHWNLPTLIAGPDDRLR